MERRMITIGIAAFLLLASFTMTIQIAGGEEIENMTDPTEVTIDLQEPLDQGEIPDISGSLPHLDLGDAVFSPVEDRFLENDYSELRSVRNDLQTLEPPTRASDEENEQDVHDYPNGSKLTSVDETIAGTLTYDPDDVSSDWKDWYKFSVDDINEMANFIDGVRNVTVSIVSYTDGSDGYDDLYELSVDSTGALVEEYADFLTINLLYFDLSGVYADMGNFDLLFDDQDDNDGWSHDANWSTNFVTPVNSEGTEDTDGFANGLTEDGWYYVGIGFDFYIRDQTFSRDLFTIKYSLRIDTTTQQNTDQGSNARDDAQAYTGTDKKFLHSRWNQVDWYKVQGSDPADIWNISLSLHRLDAPYGWDDEAQTRFVDNWLWTFVTWRNPGEDEEWGTSDDGWSVFYRVLTYTLDGGGYVSNAGQYLNVTYRDWAIENPEREVYIGIIMEPVMIAIDSGTIQGFYFYSPYVLWNYYEIGIDIVEETPNTAPTLSDLEIRSDWAGHETGGHYESEFTFNITYTDIDNDPPDDFNLVFQPYTMDETIVDMKMYEADSGDTDYTDGKDYSYMATGQDLDEDYTPHIIMVNASDTIGVESIRFQGSTGDIYYNDTLYVWNDEPVHADPAYGGEEVFDEDVGDEIQLGGTGNLIVDPEQSFLGFQIWNTTSESWKSDYNSDLLHIKIEFSPGAGWIAVVTPKADQNGEEMVTFRGFDEHSNITVESMMIITPINDLPVVGSIEIDGTSYDVDSSRPQDPEIHLESVIEIFEDEELTIEIDVLDIDNEDSEITFSYIETNDGDWDGTISVDENTGTITLTPNNNDVKKNNNEIVVDIDDGSNDIVTLTIYLELTNVNDPPVIELDPSLLTTYEKDDEISIVPRISDPDPGASWTVAVNMLVDIDDVDPIVDQLPNADLVEDLDWTFNENIGRFTMKTDDWMIWWTSSGFSGIIKITIVLEVEDDGGATDSVQVEFTLTTEEGPPPPSVDDLPTPTHTVDAVNYDVPGTYGLTVDFTVSGDVENIYGEAYEPRWEYNGVVISSEEEFQYEFDTDGLKVVYLYYEKGEERTEKKAYRLDLEETIVLPPVIKKTGDNETFPVVAVVIIIIVVIVIVLLVAIFFVMRKKKEPLAADQEYYDDQQQLGGRGSAPGLGAQARTQGLSPARETEHTEKLPPKRDATPGMSCPHCGAAVQKGWFLCPDCKSPLD